ncbi:hypothetical protein EHS25_005564 [Saitozyma podzolica]|uniref:Uncharacterized protein n=1 Tax=Saitozyma podzolica TaxID=1890683 RepID=A0A427XXU3_9TREE|nr:hypothetical protein EHS25_005564 [Saitozyma podzolica]
MSARSVHSLKPEPHAVPHASRKELKLKGGLCISHMTVDSALGQVPGNFNPAILMVVDLAVDRNASNLPSPASQTDAVPPLTPSQASPHTFPRRESATP